MAEHIAARLHRPGPKRILALDGGGTRGIALDGTPVDAAAAKRDAFEDEPHCLDAAAAFLP